MGGVLTKFKGTTRKWSREPKMPHYGKERARGGGLHPQRKNNTFGNITFLILTRKIVYSQNILSFKTKIAPHQTEKGTLLTYYPSIW